jgi:nucleotide-binding universal stress UspA family protein
MQFTNILIPTDFSQNSANAYELALIFAKKKSARLHLLHVIEPVIYYTDNPLYPDKINHDKERYFCAEEELERFINKYSNSDADINRVVMTGKPYEEILKYVKNENIDLLIISTHGRTNLEHMVAGNVTKKVLKFSEVPVICIKTAKAPVVPESQVHENMAENWVG